VTREDEKRLLFVHRYSTGPFTITETIMAMRLDTTHFVSFNAISMTLIVRCPMCKKEDTVHPVAREQLDAWQHGMLISRAFPWLTADQREQIKTGFCIPCWNATMKDV
jgi:hypothetical protein